MTKFSFRERLKESGSFFFFLPPNAQGLVIALAPCKCLPAIVGTLQNRGVCEFCSSLAFDDGHHLASLFYAKMSPKCAREFWEALFELDMWGLRRQVSCLETEGLFHYFWRVQEIGFVVPNSPFESCVLEYQQSGVSAGFPTNRARMR